MWPVIRFNPFSPWWWSSSPLPYGVVMASGGAGEVAAIAGWVLPARVLTVIAIVQAVLIAFRGLVQGDFRMPRWRFGLFTVALGLAVVSSNAYAWWPVLGQVTMGLAWLTTVFLLVWRLLRLWRSSGRHELVDGSWFLAPAALFGDAAAAVAMPGSLSPWLTGLVVVVSLLGVAGYGLVVLASALRLWRRGFGGSPLAPWWIAAGCGGLAAATLGEVAGMIAGTELERVLDGLAVATWAFGSFVLVGVLVGCVLHAWRRSRGPWQPVWPPVFSTAVYASGTAWFTTLVNVDWLWGFTLAVIASTLGLWAINSGLWLWRSVFDRDSDHSVL